MLSSALRAQREIRKGIREIKNAQMGNEPQLVSARRRQSAKWRELDTHREVDRGRAVRGDHLRTFKAN